jgi:hypothetical protein
MASTQAARRWEECLRLGLLGSGAEAHTPYAGARYDDAGHLRQRRHSPEGRAPQAPDQSLWIESSQRVRTESQGAGDGSPVSRMITRKQFTDSRSSSLRRGTSLARKCSVGFFLHGWARRAQPTASRRYSRLAICATTQAALDKTRLQF